MSAGEMRRAQEARARADAYEVLAVCLSPPSPEVAEASSKAQALFSLPPLDPAAMSPEYHRLFVGPGSLPAPPYESVYREGWRVMGETTLAVQREYEAAGYALDPSFADLPDHVAVEFGFMALLAGEEAKAWDAEDALAALAWLERERDFLADHLTRWVPAFCAHLRASAEAAFYRRLAVVLEEFLILDLGRATGLISALEEVLA